MTRFFIWKINDTQQLSLRTQLLSEFVPSDVVQTWQSARRRIPTAGVLQSLGDFLFLALLEGPNFGIGKSNNWRENIRELATGPSLPEGISSVACDSQRWGSFGKTCRGQGAKGVLATNRFFHLFTRSRQAFGRLKLFLNVSVFVLTTFIWIKLTLTLKTPRIPIDSKSFFSLQPRKTHIFQPN